MGVQAVGDFVEDAGVLIESNQAVANGAVFVADIEPYTVSAVFNEGAVFEHHPAGQTYLVAARLPAPIESFGIVVSHRTSGHSEPVRTHGSKTKLTVVLERAAADHDVFASECRAAGIGIFEDTILDGQMIA